MLHLVMVEDRVGSPFYGREVVKAATVIECPPLLVLGFRAYAKTEQGLKSIGEVWASDPPRDLERVFTTPEKFNTEEQLKKIEDNLERVEEIRLIVATQPRRSGLGKKKPEVFEVKIDGGTMKDRLEYAKSLLGKEVRVTEVFEEGQYIDVVAVTKGKGTQGPVKRFGVKILPRWHKHRKGYRKVGTAGPQHPSVMFTIPRAGQMGFHQRTEYNKRILVIGTKAEEINPKGGWKHYGIVRSDFIVIEGSIPGPAKRLIRMRFPIRPPQVQHSGKPKIVWISVKPIMAEVR